MPIPIDQIDAFTTRPFGGNAVTVTRGELSEAATTVLGL